MSRSPPGLHRECLFSRWQTPEAQLYWHDYPKFGARREHASSTVTDIKRFKRPTLAERGSTVAVPLKRSRYPRFQARSPRVGVLRCLFGLACCLAGTATLVGQVQVLTYHNDLARTGQNTNETVLTPANVNSNSFGKLFAYAVDGQVYAQPLYVSNLDMGAPGVHNVVFIATEHDGVYALDADGNSSPTGGVFWQVSLGTSAATPNNDFGNRYGPYSDIEPEVGITSTPVIDLASGTLYVDAFTHEGSIYFHRIHALNITNGVEQPHSPVPVSASVPGLGVASTNGVVEFDAQQQLQRPALTLLGGVLYVAFSGYADTDPYHGWVIGFDAATLRQLTNYVFNTTPNTTVAVDGPSAGEGGIWMSGDGLAADIQGNLYLEIGNGSFNANQPGGTEYGDSFVKLSTAGGLSVADYFAPYNQAYLASNDWDLGSGGPLVLPDSVGSAAHPHLLVGCGKEGKIFLLDRDHLGGFDRANDSQIVQELPNAVGGTWSSPAYFNNQIYYQGVNDVLKAFSLTNGLLNPTPTSRSATLIHFPSPTPAISAHGTNAAIAWILQTDNYRDLQPAILHAYDAYDLSLELYNSEQSGARDRLAPAVKFTVPTIANGKVYVGADQEVVVFGKIGVDSLPLQATPGSKGQVILQWTSPGTLEEATDLSGPWTTSPNQTSPQTVTAVGTRFYRLRQ